MKIFKKAKRGFTLVELVVVIAVIAILAAVSVGAYFGVTESANKSKLEQEGKQFHTAIQTVALRNDSNHSLNADGLTVVDPEIFDTALTEVMGQEVEVMVNDPKIISKPTIVLNNTAVNEQVNVGSGTLYKTFDYYTPEVGGRKIAIDVVTGDFKHYDKLSFEIDKENTEEASYISFLFENNWDWPDAAVFYWGSEFVADTVMPGNPLTEIIGQNGQGKDIYSVTIPSDVTGFLFTGTGGYGAEQSADILLADVDIEENTCFYMTYDDSTKTKPCGSYLYEKPTVNPDTPTDDEVEKRTVYFANYDWTKEEGSKLYAYAWAGQDNNGWPGAEMTEDSEVENLYYVELPVTYENLIFNNGNGSQTDDLDFTGYDAESGKIFYNIKNDTWTTKPAEITVPAFDEVSIVGTINGWDLYDQGSILNRADGDVYSITLENLKVGDEFKFVKSHSYDTEYHFKDVNVNEDAALIAASENEKPNIKVAKHGTFTFTLTLSEEKEIAYTFVPHVHDYHNEESKCECGDTCKHSEFDSNSICTLCGFVCESHEWSVGVCRVCGKVCSHETYNENSVCTVCGNGCSHSYVEGTCEHCGSSDPDYVPPAVEPYSVYIKGSMNNWSENEDYKLSYAYEGGYWYKKDVALSANATFKIFYNDGSADHWINNMGGEKTSYIEWSGDNLKVTKTGTYNIVFSEETEILAVIPSDKVATSVELKGSFDSWANPITFEQSPENEYVYTLDVTWNAKTEFKVILMGQYNGHESLDSTSKALSSGSDWGNIIVNPGSYTISYNFTTGYISIVSK